jgi:hypothetical protein
VRRPTDLLGLASIEYNVRADGLWTLALDTAATIIENEIARSGIRPPDGGRSAHSLVARDEVDSVVGSVRQRLGQANEEVWISGNDCKFVVEAESQSVREALKRGVQVSVLCVHPDGPGAEALALIDPRFDSPSEFRDAMLSVRRGLERMRNEFDGFSFRLLPLAPAIGLFITDPNGPTGVVKAEIYTAKPWRTRPNLIAGPSDSDPWWGYWIEQWRNYWALGRDV